MLVDGRDARGRLRLPKHNTFIKHVGLHTDVMRVLRPSLYVDKPSVCFKLWLRLISI